SNNSFVDQLAFDGLRQHLLKDFTRVFHLDLHGNVQKNPKLSGTTHNVFGIKVGVGLTIAIRHMRHSGPHLYYFRVGETWRKEEKLSWLAERGSMRAFEWCQLTPDSRSNWISLDNADVFAEFTSIGDKVGKSSKQADPPVIF